MSGYNNEYEKMKSNTNETGDTTGEDHDNDNVADEDDLEKLQAEIAKMEEEAARIAAETASLEQREKGQGGLDQQQSGSQSVESKDNNLSSGDKASVDKLSIYVGQVDYSTTPEELLAHFEPCGQVERVTINCDKFTGRPKGFAYLEFQSEEAVQNALKLDGSSFKGRNLKVTRKRVNDPNYYYNQMQQQYQQQIDTMHGEAHGFPGGGRFGRGGRGRGLPAAARGGRGFVMIPPPPVPFVGGRGLRGRGRGFGPPAAARGRSYRGGFRGARGGGGGAAAGSGYQPYY